jgi:hypothetical protein
VVRPSCSPEARAERLRLRFLVEKSVEAGGGGGVTVHGAGGGERSHRLVDRNLREVEDTLGRSSSLLGRCLHRLRWSS